jgi:hypothetical protein
LLELGHSQPRESRGRAPSLSCHVIQMRTRLFARLDLSTRGSTRNRTADAATAMATAARTIVSTMSVRHWTPARASAAAPARHAPRDNASRCARRPRRAASTAIRSVRTWTQTPATAEPVSISAAPAKSAIRASASSRATPVRPAMHLDSASRHARRTRRAASTAIRSAPT